ncbi:helix-turn-helix domain-containing protein, partial [Escherichia coli]
TGKREPDFETLETIADYFNVDMNYLIGFSNDPLDYEKIGNEEGISPPEDYEGSYEDWVRYKLQENPEYVSDNIDYIAKNTEVNPNLSLTA